MKAFVEPSRQERFLTFLVHPKKRRKFTDELRTGGIAFCSQSSSDPFRPASSIRLRYSDT